LATTVKNIPWAPVQAAVEGDDDEDNPFGAHFPPNSISSRSVKGMTSVAEPEHPRSSVTPAALIALTRP
jgi:hypothetical protein